MLSGEARELARVSHDVAYRGDQGLDVIGNRLQHLRERLNVIYQRLFRGDAPNEAHAEAKELEEQIARTLREERLNDPEAAALRAVDTV